MEPWFDEAETQAVFNYMKGGGWVMEFKKTEELEKRIAEFTGAKYAMMTVNGTISLTIALLALGIKEGDEILVPDLTMIATPNSAALVGIKPILVDVEPKTLCLDLEKAEKIITRKTKAMIYVPLNGRAGGMKAIVKFCKKHKLFLIEDAAQALGSFWGGKHLGTFGQIGSFSFSVPKIITTGQGGALITDSPALYKKMKLIKDFGRSYGGNDIHDDWGWNFKFTDLQAVIGIEQMKKLPWRLKRKKEIYQRYVSGLKDIKGIEFIPTDLKNTSPWFIDIYVKNRGALAAHLESKGIGTRKIYPPVHTQKIYHKAYRRKHFPVSVHYSNRGLWLPSSSKLSNAQIDYIIDSIREYYFS